MPDTAALNRSHARIAWFATKGSGTNDALRLQTLLSRLPDTVELPFSKSAKLASFKRLLRAIRAERPRLLVMEGTGLAGGLACMLAKILWKIPYVFSSGDAVGPFIQAHHRWLGAPFGLYERLLCRMAAGFIGWTPYLCGRALTLGCPSAMTAAGWPLGAQGKINLMEQRAHFRNKWGIPADALVVGIVGALEWNARREYCYGLELVQAAARLKREDVVVVVVGSGSGTIHLQEAAGSHLGARVRLPGPVLLEEVMPCLAAFDVASLPQSTDLVGAFRYTTKLSEYAAARLPVITSRIPAAYDLGQQWMWRLPGAGPWTREYVTALAELLEQLDAEQIDRRKAAIPMCLDAFDREAQIERTTEFLEDVLAGCRSKHA